MAALTSTASSIQHIQHERFTSKQHGYQLWYLTLNSSGNITACGYNNKTWRTFIDLYFGRNSDSRDKLKLYYSKEFEKYSNHLGRYISFLEINGSELLLTCIGDKIDIIDTKNESKVLNSCRVNGEITCLAVREGEIFIGLLESKTVIVFNNDLKETKKIKLKGIQEGDCPWDLQVIKDTVFACTLNGRALSISESDGSSITEYTNTTGKYRYAHSITVSEKLGLVAVVWSDCPASVIIVYSLAENKSLLVCDGDYYVRRIRISDKDRMIITGNHYTGEIKMYDLEQLFSFETMKRTLAYIISRDECEELRKYFGVREEELRRKEMVDEDKSKKLSVKGKTMQRLKCLCSIIEGKGHLDPYNINGLKDAVSTTSDVMRVSNLKGPLEGYALYGKIMVWQEAMEEKQNKLNYALITAKMKINEYEKTVEAQGGELLKMKNQFEELEQTLTSQLEQTKQSLHLSRRESAEKIKTLKEQIDHTKKESTKTIETLTKELKEIQTLRIELNQTKQSLDLSRTESAEKINILTGELHQTKNESTTTIETLTEKLSESTKEIETLTSQLKHTRQSLDVSKTESTKEIKLLTSQLDQARRSFDLSRAESTKQKETLRNKLDNARTESAKDLENLTVQLEKTKQESDKKMQTLSEKLIKTKQLLDVSKTESAKKIETLNEELEQIRTKSTKTIETLTDELTQTRLESTKEIEVVMEELKQSNQSLDTIGAESTKQKELLSLELEQTKQKLDASIKEKEACHRDLEITKQLFEQAIQDRDSTRTELKRYQLDFAKESKALKEVLNQTREAMVEQQKGAVKEKPLLDSEETRDEDVTVLAAEFGRLTVAIADYLTLDDCLKLAILFNVPAADCDIVRRVSINESPGVKLLDVLKKRKVINMFDITNLQKGLAMLHLEAVNQNLIIPYRERVDEECYEVYKAEEMFTWEQVDEFVNPVKVDTVQMTDSQTLPDDPNVPNRTSQGEPRVPQSEKREVDRASLSRGRHNHQWYIEHSISREGGTIQLANVSLIIPPDALHETHVIALSVINEPPFPLDREVDTARLTPLLRLEPLGLTFKKSLQLNIPHSAIIPEPENHDVIIYSGHEDYSGSITWTEEGSVLRQLHEKSVTVDIECLSYLSAYLVSQTTAPPLYIRRAVLFVDGVRNTDDDITVTICFCNDNESEYNMLLSDYKTKLPLEQYSTLQLHRHSESDEDDAGFLSVTITSFHNTYTPDAEQTVKRFAVSHLCTASRVSHQLRLRKNQDADKDTVDIVLTFSQAQYEPTEISLKARIKDLIISEESEKRLTGSLTQGSKTFEDLLFNVSSSIDRQQCRELANYFQLTSEEKKMVTSTQDPGKMLMKILEERAVINSQKMILFFEGLKACHLDKTAILVSEYIKEIRKQTQEEEQKPEEEEKIEDTGENSLVSQLLKKGQRAAHSSLSDQSVQTTFSSSCVSADAHVKTLTKEGYTEHEVIEALDISRNRLVTARTVLQFLGEQLDKLPKKDFFLHKEQYIDENGGDIYLQEANVHMVIPAGALSEGSIVSLTMMTSKQGNVPTEGRTPQLTPVIKCGQMGLTLNKLVTIRIPHCVSETTGITDTDMSLGFSSNDEGGMQWRKRKRHEPAPVLKKHHFEIFLAKFYAISLNVAVDYKRPLKKRLRVLPLIHRIVNLTDDLVVILWIYNDDETEHMHLLHEEINVGGKIQLFDFKIFTIKGLGSDKEVHVRSGNNKIIPHPNTNMKKILSSAMWHNTRNSAEFYFQNKEGINDISFKLRICKKQFLRTVDDLQFDLKVTLSELLQKHQVSSRALLQIQQPQPAMVKSFQELVSKLSVHINVDSCLEIAGMFGLRAEFRAAMKESRVPGKVLFDELIHEQFITAASVSALDVALTKTGNEHLAEYVKKYRLRNVTFPTTVFTLL